MGILSKLTGSKEKETVQSTPMTTEAPPCPHVVLIAKWDKLEDMGHEDRASHYICEGCGESFTPAEAEQLRGAAAEKLIAPVAESTS